MHRRGPGKHRGGRQLDAGGSPSFFGVLGRTTERPPGGFDSGAAGAAAGTGRVG